MISFFREQSHLRTFRRALFLGPILLGISSAAGCGPLLRLSWEKHRQQEMVFFATDRAPAKKGIYGGVRDTLKYGYAIVDLEYYLPRSGLPQGITLDSRAQRINRTVESTLRFRFRSKVELPESTFYSMLRTAYDDRGRPARRDTTLILFIHGYNVDFTSAIERTANLRYRTNAQAAIAYSWPSRGKLLQYVTDLDQARWTAPHLSQFLTALVREVNGRHVNVVVHSMGTQALAQAVELSSMRSAEAHKRLGADSVSRTKALRSITFVNPDFDEELFFRDAVPLFGSVADRLTLYGTPRDIPLFLAAFLRSGYPRAGQIHGRDMECPAVLDCVDVTPALKRAGLNHFEILTPNSPITHDFAHAVVAGNPAKCRAALRTYEQRGSVWVMLRNPGGYNPLEIPESCLQFGPAHQLSIPVTQSGTATIQLISDVFTRRFGSAVILNDSTVVRSEPVVTGVHHLQFEAAIVPADEGLRVRVAAYAAADASGFEEDGVHTMVSDAPHWQSEWILVRELAEEIRQSITRETGG